VQVPPEEVPMREDLNASDGQDAYDDDDDYGDDDEYQGQPDLPWPPAGPPGPPGPPGPRYDRRARHAILLAVIAALAAAVGFVVVTAIHDVSASPAAANGATPGASASATPGNPQAGNPQASPLPTSGSGQELQMEIAGKVAAVSATSITLDGAGQQITATVTGATKVTGRVTSIGGVKPGDVVSAQLTGTGGSLTATAIQDPASLP
jgi:hypothetical protein